MSTTRINITAERLRVEALTQPLHHPSFIPDPTVATSNPSVWKNTILPTIATYTFELASLPDTDFFRSLLARPELPDLYKVITSLSFPQFYQFAGIRDNRTSNPYLDAAKSLPALEHLTLTFHTAGLTTSVHHERERIALENLGKVEESKELRVLRTKEVVAFYKLDDVFELKKSKLKKVTLVLVDSELVGHFVKKGRALEPFQELGEFFEEGFKKVKREVEVDLVLVPLAYTG
ncbi:hypothetical protein P171DRAFT_435632 [Karstenula rhodostoma CBS 690.94]|uniref:Uncharacterized protein n=1 Tax=Karstenula rhodostoma CBS 690.94 TaxID=1392251 RepID=A0A9P4PAY3_9PLEO|nr:hypothetical protein P171DRAFT_435632 [Karstenula rhodostoma CBS 690.94]